MTENAQLEALLEQVLLELRALPSAIARAVAAADRSNGCALYQNERKALRALLPEIARSIGVEVVFSVQDLLAGSQLNPALQSALWEALGTEMLNGKDTKRLGKLLGRAAGYTDNGVGLERAGKAREGVLWHLVTSATMESRASPRKSPTL